MGTVKVLLTLIGGLAAVAVPMIKWWLNQRSQKAKNQKEALANAEEKIDNDGDTGDLQSDVDDLLNGL